MLSLVGVVLYVPVSKIMTMAKRIPSLKKKPLNQNLNEKKLWHPADDEPMPSIATVTIGCLILVALKLEEAQRGTIKS